MTESNFQSNTWKPLEDSQDLRYTPIRFLIPILRLAIISIARNEMTHRIKPNPILPLHTSFSEGYVLSMKLWRVELKILNIVPLTEKTISHQIITFKQTSCKWICLQETYCWQFAQVVNTSQPVNSLNFFSHQRAYSCNLQLTNKTLVKIARFHFALVHAAFWHSVELCLHLVPGFAQRQKNA